MRHCIGLTIIIYFLYIPFGSKAIHEDNFILYVDRGKDMIYKIDILSGEHEGILTGHRFPLGVTYHPVVHRIYWADRGWNNVSETWIGSASLEKPPYDVKLWQMKEASFVRDVAVDFLSGNIYYTDNGDVHIGVVNSNLSTRTILVRQGLIAPRGITLHPLLRYIFVTEYPFGETDGSNARLTRLYMDGSNITVIVNQGLKQPTGITIDYQENRVYWCDCGTKSIESVDINGLSRRLVFQSELDMFYALTMDANYIYATTLNSIWIKCITRGQGQMLDYKPHLSPSDSTSLLSGIHLYNSSMLLKALQWAKPKPETSQSFLEVSTLEKDVDAWDDIGTTTSQTCPGTLPQIIPYSGMTPVVEIIIIVGCITVILIICFLLASHVKMCDAVNRRATRALLKGNNHIYVSLGIENTSKTIGETV